MSSKELTLGKNKEASKQQSPQPNAQNFEKLTQRAQLSTINQRDRLEARSLTPQDVRYLQRTTGNRAVGLLLSPAMQNTSHTRLRSVAQRKPVEDGFGMPVQRREVLEALSAMDLSGVSVHKNSAKPVQLNALAYMQGAGIRATDIGRSAVHGNSKKGRLNFLYTTAAIQGKDIGDTETEAAGATIDRLRDALGRGVDEVERVARQIPLPDLSAALASLPEAVLALLDALWPDNTGWAAHVKVDGNVNLALTDFGFPGELALDGNGAVDASIKRTGGTISISISPSVQGGGAGIPSIKLLELPIGVHVKEVFGATLAVDLARVNWPTGALTKLFAFDIKGALNELMTTALTLGGNTQLALKGGLSGTIDISGEAGLTSILKAAVKTGGQIGAEVSIVTPTEASAGKVELSGQLGIFAGVDFRALGGEDVDPTAILKTLIGVLGKKNLTPIFGAGLTGSDDIGLRFTLNIPPFGKDASPQLLDETWIEIGIFVIGTLGGKLLGQSGDAKARAEVTLQLPDIPGFIAALEDGVDVEDSKLLEMVSGFNASFGVTGVLRDYVGLFPMLVDWFPELDMIEDANRVSVAVSVAVKATREQIEAIDERTRGGMFDLITRMATGDALGGLRDGADAALENLADIIGFFDKITFDVTAGTERMFSIDTPGNKDITGIGIGGEEHISRTYHHDATPEQLGITTVEQWLRHIIIDDRESYVPAGPRESYVPAGPRENYPPPPRKTPVQEAEKVTNTENVRLVRDPKRWNDDTMLLERLPKGMHVTRVHKGVNKSFNRTTPEYQWWFVRAGTKEGWVMQVLLDDVGRGP